MLRNLCSRLVPVLLLVALPALGLTPASAGPDTPASRTPHHKLSVRFALKSHRLVAEDRLTLPAGGSTGTRTLTFDLAPKLALRAIEVAGQEHPVALPERAADGSFTIEVPHAQVDVTFRYDGEVFDAVKKANDLSWVVGDNTTGVISERGVYLSGASRWYPRPRVRVWPLARFSVTTYIETPYLTVTQGTVPTRTSTAGPSSFAATTTVAPPRTLTPDEAPADGERVWTRSVSAAEVATDSCHLSAGRWVTSSREVEGVTISTYFDPSEKDAQALWLDETAKSVKRYAKILGPYPHSKFDVVSNFFQSGYGMPGWTLLGNRVIQYVTMKAKYTGGIPPGYLDHEYVHGWYGNGLAVDYASGNWCEAITTYLANYYAKELTGADEAKEHRRGVLEKFCIRVRGKSDYALRKFITKTEDADNDVGYGKGSMFFHTLRQRVGDEAFWKTLRDVTTKHVGQVVTWGDWLKAFDAAPGGTHAEAVLPLLDRAGLPSITLGDVTVQQSEGADVAMVTLDLKLSAPAFPKRAPLRITLTDGTVVLHSLQLDTEHQTALLPVTGTPAIVEIDPDFHMLRRIPDAELPLCLNRTLEQTDGVIVVRNNPEVFGGLADRLVRATGWTRVDQDEVPAGVHCVVLGVTERDGGLAVGGETFAGPMAAVMTTRVTQDGHFETRYDAASVKAAARVGYATYYGWDGWIGFQSGRVAKRGMLRPESTSTRKVLAEVKRQASAATQRVQATVETLCSAAFDGRRPGAAGHTKALDWIEAQVRANDPNGIATLTRQSFSVGLRDSGDVRASWRDAADAPSLEGVRFRPLPNTTPASYAGALQDIVVIEGVMEPAALTALLAKHQTERRLVLIAENAGQGDAPAAWVDHPGDLTAQGAAAYDASTMGRRGPRPAPVVEPWISGRRARLPALPVTTGGAFVVTGEQASAVLAFVKAGGAGRLEVTIAPQSIPVAQGTNLIVDILPFVVAGEMPQPTVLCAHYDALGRDGDRFFAGADDNASGVACLLEVLRSVTGERGVRPARMNLRVIFLDAEEWGLRGSTHYVASLDTAKGRATLPPAVVVNVDSIGRALSQPTYVLGHSHYGALADALGKHLQAAGLKLPQRSIDRFAYPHGSDHWPFHTKGIPAVSLWATDYAVMNTPKDTVDGVEAEGIAKIAEALAAWLRG